MDGWVVQTQAYTDIQNVVQIQGRDTKAGIYIHNLQWSGKQEATIDFMANSDEPWPAQTKLCQNFIVLIVEF